MVLSKHCTCIHKITIIDMKINLIITIIIIAAYYCEHFIIQDYTNSISLIVIHLFIIHETFSANLVIIIIVCTSTYNSLKDV